MRIGKSYHIFLWNFDKFYRWQELLNKLFILTIFFVSQGLLSWYCPHLFCDRRLSAFVSGSGSLKMVLYLKIMVYIMSERLSISKEILDGHGSRKKEKRPPKKKQL